MMGALSACSLADELAFAQLPPDVRALAARVMIAAAVEAIGAAIGPLGAVYNAQTIVAFAIAEAAGV